MPATDDPEADRACFLAIMTMDEEGLRARFKGIKPKTKVLEQATDSELQAYTDLESLWVNAPTPAEKRERKEELATAFRELELAVFSRLPYDEQIALCDRPEQIDGPSPESWQKINAHLGTSAPRHLGTTATTATTATSISELVAQLGQNRFGRIPRVGDAFCGGGSIPFEAARIGCEAYASDLNPVAALLTWSALNIVGGGPEVAAQVREAQEDNYTAVDTQVSQWGIGEKTKAIARLIPIPAEKRYRIEILSGVSAAEMKAAKNGTIAKGKITHPILLKQGRDPGTLEQARLLSSRDQKTTPATHHPNGLRLWENDDLVPRPDDVFQERLYCVRWVESYRNDKGDLRTRKHYREVTPADQAREEKTLTLLRERFTDWQSEGFLPSMKIEPGAKTDEPIRTRGWTYWHHLFNPRQLILYGTMGASGLADQPSLVCSAASFLGIGRCADYNTRLAKWAPQIGYELTANVFSNQALNTIYNPPCRGLSLLKNTFSLRFEATLKPSRKHPRRLRTNPRYSRSRLDRNRHRRHQTCATRNQRHPRKASFRSKI